jgi:uncharacterized membrane protein YeaQ/YmgE (transglycosylase-associated protein family)
MLTFWTVLLGLLAGLATGRLLRGGAAGGALLDMGAGAAGALVIGLCLWALGLADRAPAISLICAGIGAVPVTWAARVSQGRAGRTNG